MPDRLHGRVAHVIDGDTFDIDVTWVSRRNKYSYRRSERVRIKGIDAPELPTRQGNRSRRALERCLSGETVALEIVARDRYYRLIANVCVIGFLEVLFPGY